MDKTSAIKIIRQTFQNPFDKESFVYFIKNLLNYIEPAPFIYRGNFIPDAYKPYIKTFERIGKYQDKDGKKIDLLIVRLKKETSLERARTMQRNFIAWYLNGSRGDVLKDAALVAFVSPGSDDWRFSLVKMDYRLDASGEKVRVRQELTPARRFSFLVGKTESSHTAQSRLVPILQDDSRDPTLRDLEEAFSVEKVTKEFFEKYRQLFYKIKESLDEVVKRDKKVQQDFKEKNIDTVNFAKKLLGQIVFLYFLQKKGWFGVERDKDWGTGPKNFLRLLFEKEIADYDNFFNEILEPLFYEALAVERTDNFYTRFNCKIPFLNGGLFDPLNNYDWVHTDILLPNELFSNNIKTKEGDIGTGILDIFDRYNFTVKEDEPLEKEVAVDPEMLGKVFENLLEVKDRKSKGTYYTPREIVHYMCQQSLINYLANELKGKVKKEDIEMLIKYGETAVEHDSRVIKEGKETKVYSFKIPKSIRDNAKLIDEKLASIRVCDPAVGSGAFPVGMMNEIIRTRNALTNYLKDKKKRTIYNFKRHTIQNCLYGVDIDPGAVEIAKLRLWLSLIVDEEDIKRIKPLPNLDYKIVCGNSLLGVEKNLFNQKLFAELEELKPLYFNETNARKKQGYKNQIDKLIAQITNGHKDFDFKVYFSEVFHEKKGFDVVIANPPYVDYRDISREIIKKLAHYQLTIDSSRPNLYMYFIEKSYYILRNSGVLVFINPNQFLSIDAGLGLRRFLLENTIIKFLIDVSYVRIFRESATYTVVWLFQKEKRNNYKIKVNRCFSLENIDKTSFFITKKEVMRDRNFIIPIQEEHKLLLKIENKHVRLGQICKMAWGTSKSGYGKLKIQKRDYEILNLEKKKLYGPILQTRDIKRYFVDWQGEYIPVDIYSENIKYTFKKKKIIIARVAKELKCAYDDESRFIGKATIITDFQVDKNYLLALLNSNLINYWYSSKFETTHMASGYLRFDIPYLSQIPIPSIARANQKRIISIVNKILAITKDDDYLTNSTKQAKVRDYEKQIDQLVYKLYGLTPEEIKIVESYGTK